MSRRDYRICVILSLAQFFVGSIVLFSFFGDYFRVSPFGGMLMLALLSALIGFITLASVRRYNDLDRSGWHLFPHQHGMLEEWKIWKELFMEEGTKGPNQYGSDPTS